MSSQANFSLSDYLITAWNALPIIDLNLNPPKPGIN